MSASKRVYLLKSEYILDSKQLNSYRLEEIVGVGGERIVLRIFPKYSNLSLTALRQRRVEDILRYKAKGTSPQPHYLLILLSLRRVTVMLS